MTEGSIPVRGVPATLDGAAYSLRLSPRLGWQILQFVADFASVFAASYATYAAYLWTGLGRSHLDVVLYGKLSLTVAALTVFALHGYGAYRNSMGLLRIESVRRVIHAVGSALVLLLAMTVFLKLPGFSRITLLLMGPVMVALLSGQRMLLWSLQARWAQRSRSRRPALIYGAGATGRLLAQRLREEHQWGLVPAGFLDDECDEKQVRVGPGRGGERFPVLGNDDTLEQVIDDTQAAVVFLAMPSASSERIAELVARLETLGMPYFFVPSAGELLLSALQFGEVAGMPVFTRRRPGRDPVYELAQRSVDIVVSVLTLLLTLPVLAAAVAAIKATSPGPVLFRQQRAGLRGKTFTIFKLRTMHTVAPKYALHPEDSRDTRITRVGRFLRRTSIDELPQLWNVLRGEMSLVGPRPEMPFVVAGYDEIHRQRLTIKPGLTGLWQISADRTFSIHDNMQYDLYYVENRSFALDLAILVMTPLAAVLARDGAK